MNRLKHLLFPILLSVLCSQAKDSSSESGYWDHIVTEAVNQLDSIIEANNSIEYQQNQDASSIPNYFVDLRSNKAVPLSQSFINTLNNYIYEQQGSYLYKDKKYAAYVLLTDRLAAINTDDLLLYFQGLNKVNKLDDINTASVKSLQEAYYGVYGRPKFKFEPIVYPSETVQNVANKPVVTSYKPVETAHDLAIKRIAKLSKISQSDKLGILLGIDLTYGTPSMLSKLSSNSPASAKIEVNTSVAVDKRMALELSSSIKSDLNAEELYMSYAYKTLEAKIKGKTETLFQIVKGFNSPNAVYKAELELFLQSFELKAAQYQLSAKDISDKLTDQHLQEINASQLLRLLTLTYKFQKWDGNADGLVVWILKKIPQKHAYQLYKYLDYKPKGQTYTVLAHWHDNIRPGTFDVESDMGDMNQALKSLLKKIPISAFAQELKDMSQDPVRNLNIAYDYPENKCNTNPSLLSPKFDDASFDLKSGEVNIDYYGIDVSMNLRTCCDKIIRPSGTPAPQCYYFDHRLSTRQSTRTLGATQLVYLTDFSDGIEKVYYMPAYFLANLTVNAHQKIKEARVWLMVEVAVTALTWEMGGEPGIAMFLARTSAVTGLVSTSAAVAANLGNESMPESLKNSLNAIATSTGLVSLGTGVGSFVAYYRAASKTIASGKMANLQKASENLQDELNTAIQHTDELGISPTDLEKYKGALSELQANYANVFKVVYVPKVLKFVEIAFSHSPTSGALITKNAKQGTFLVGSFNSDLDFILRELNYPEITDYNLLRPSANPEYLTPLGQKFNMLNVSKEVVDYFSKKGGFFNIVNARWVDAAVIQNADIFIVSKLEDLYSAPGRLSGFGKEVHRFEWKHGYRYDPDTKMMVPPNKANKLPTRTLQNENFIGD